MKKKAVIIVTPNLPDHDKLPGATMDADAWKSFLISPEGGAWKDEEINVMSDTSKEIIELTLNLHKLMNLDYALIAFSGHGHYKILPDRNTETRMFISKDDYLTEHTLTVRAKRELVVMDACRQYGGEVIEETTKMAHFANRETILAEDRFAKAREAYEKALVLSPEGRTLIYSCTLNQAAADKLSFTRFLISDAERLARECRYFKTISVKEAFDVAQVKTFTNNYPQQPTFDGGRRSTHFPFSVSL